MSTRQITKRVQKFDKNDMLYSEQAKVQLRPTNSNKLYSTSLTKLAPKQNGVTVTAPRICHPKDAVICHTGSRSVKMITCTFEFHNE